MSSTVAANRTELRRADSQEEEDDTTPLSSTGDDAEGEEEAEVVRVDTPTAHKDLLLGIDRGLTFDIGNLVAFSYQPIDAAAVKEAGLAAYLEKEARDCVQQLINQVLQVPTTRTRAGDVLGSLPPGSTIIPREKPIPSTKPTTRWEKYAAAKGIQKRKKSRMAWDETERDWRPRYGYKRANDPGNAWLVEAKSSDQPLEAGEDPFSRMRKDRKERVAKQSKREQRNLGEAVRGGARSVGVSTGPILKGKANTKHLTSKADDVGKATASVGKFNARLPSEPKEQRIKGKRKFDAVVSSDSPSGKGGKRGRSESAASGGGGGGGSNGAEKKRNMAALDKVIKQREGRDPSAVPERKVNAMQKKNWGSRNKKSAY
eukprot:TRINITY_DN353_c0_g1_i1.p1 TRINITY_DN353_c0_g1~~TRINITY_DN353_c0_g1_i1.p1  ORF type:complete len:373 (-),score=113.16 TRINITY_DN353_c0_g1_i1:37-1155(-)